jgi:hypothetical protein
LHLKKTDTIQAIAIVSIIALVIFAYHDTLSHLSENIIKAHSSEDTSLPNALNSWWLAKAYLSERQPPDIVILGSSQITPLLGADAYVYDRVIDMTDDHRSYVIEHDLNALLHKKFRVFVGALPGAMISDQLAISRALFSNGYKPKLVAVTFSPRDFIDSYFSDKSSTEAFAFFSKYTNPTSLRNDLDKIREEKFDCKSNCISNSRDESALHFGKPFRRIAPEDVIIYSDDDYSYRDDTEEYKARYKNSLSPQLNMQLDCLDSLLKYLAQQHIPVVAFNLPISESNRKLLPDKFWTYYDKRISDICKRDGADYISADRVVLPFERSEFADGIHLNLIGGLRWSRPVAFYIANRFRSKPFKELLDKSNKCLL